MQSMEPQQAAPSMAQLATSLGAELEDLDRRRLRQWERPTIHRVFPRIIHREDALAFEPKLISIGPLHRHKEHLQAMELLKWRQLRDLLGRCPVNPLDKCVTGVAARVEEIRAQYSEDLETIADEELVKMMVLDGCFIIELLIKLFLREIDQLFGTPDWKIPILLSDLLLAENQIPFFVLETVFETTAPRPFAAPVPNTLMELALRIISGGTAQEMPEGSKPILRILHWLHLYHSFVVSHPTKEDAESCRSVTGHGFRKVRKMISHVGFLVSSGLTCNLPDCSSDEDPMLVSSMTIPRATKLKEAGIRLRSWDPPRGMVVDILSMKVTFSHGILEIPALLLTDTTCCYLQNLVTFEQCCPEFGACITSLVHLMGHLMETDDDVALLRDCGVIPFHRLASLREVTLFFARLRRGTFLDPGKHYYAEVIKDVNEYCKSDRRRWRAG